MSPTKTLTAAEEAERFADAAAKAIAQANEARAKADAAAERAEAERQAAIAALRLARLDAYDEAALEADLKAGRASFAEAIRSGEPGLTQFVEWQVARTRRYVVAVDAETCRAAVAPERPRIVTGSPVEMSYAVEVQRVLDSIVADKVEDLADALQAELDSAGR